MTGTTYQLHNRVCVRVRNRIHTHTYTHHLLPNSSSPKGRYIETAGLLSSLALVAAGAICMWTVQACTFGWHYLKVWIALVSMHEIARVCVVHTLKNAQTYSRAHLHAQDGSAGCFSVQTNCLCSTLSGRQAHSTQYSKSTQPSLPRSKPSTTPCSSAQLRASACLNPERCCLFPLVVHTSWKTWNTLWPSAQTTSTSQTSRWRAASSRPGTI